MKDAPIAQGGETLMRARTVVMLGTILSTMGAGMGGVAIHFGNADHEQRITNIEAWKNNLPEPATKEDIEQAIRPVLREMDKIETQVAHTDERVDDALARRKG